MKHTPFLTGATSDGKFSAADIYRPDGSPVAMVFPQNLPQGADLSAFIVRACNAHDELVRALKLARCLVSESSGNDAIRLTHIIDVALSKAKGA